MFAVQDDWIQYEGVPARRQAVRGGAACAQRIPVVRAVPARPLRVVTGTPAAVRPVAAPSARRRPLRLTRRGRIVLVVLPGLLALSGALGAVAGTADAQAAPVHPVVRTVVVGSGDTLWSIAGRIAPGADRRDVVAALQQENGLAGAEVPAGAVLRLPVLR